MFTKSSSLINALNKVESDYLFILFCDLSAIIHKTDIVDAHELEYRWLFIIRGIIDSRRRLV